MREERWTDMIIAILCTLTEIEVITRISLSVTGHIPGNVMSW